MTTGAVRASGIDASCSPSRVGRALSGRRLKYELGPCAVTGAT